MPLLDGQRPLNAAAGHVAGILESVRMPDPGGVLPGVEEVVDDGIDADAVANLGEQERSPAPHLLGIAGHHVEIGPHRHREVGLVDHQQIALGDSGAALARDLVATRHVDDLNRVVGEFATETGGEIVATGLQQEQIRMELVVQILQGLKIGRDVFADGGMRTSAGFHGANAFADERLVADQEFTVLAGEDIIGDCCDTDSILQLQAQLEHQCGFATPDGAADPDGEGTALEIAVQRQFALIEMPGMIQVLVGMTVFMTLIRAVGMGVGMRRRVHGWNW